MKDALWNYICFCTAMEKRNLSLFALVSSLAIIAAATCPENVRMEPCACAEENGESTVVCKGAIGLPRLTTLLRNDLCGQAIDKFLLTESDIGYLPSNLFYKLRVKDIQISYTNISHFTEAGRSAFYGLERHLASLSMRHCRLVNSLKWEKIGDLQVLTHLDLSFNDLTEVPRVWFRSPPRILRSLHLQGNRIAILDKDSLSSMHNLVELDLSENLISNFQRNVLPYPASNLIFLRLSYNRLESLPENYFHEMFGLRRLYLDSNLLSTLDEKVWGPIWGELQHVDLTGNDFTCDCAMRWTAVLFPPPHLYATCGSGNGLLEGRNVRDLWPWDFECGNDTLVV